MKGDETMDRKRCTLALMAVLALGLCKLQMVVAQVPPQGNQNYGTFGNRTLGQSLVPAPSTFGGGIQTAPGGSFLFLGTVGRLRCVRHALAAKRYGRALRPSRRAARPERRCFASIARGGARCSRTPVHPESRPPCRSPKRMGRKTRFGQASPWSDSPQRATSREPTATLHPAHRSCPIA